MGPPVDVGAGDPVLVAAVVLAGGAGRRMGGADKAGLLVGGVTLLDRVLHAAAGVAGRLIVVGPPRVIAGGRAVIFVQEDTPGGGPVPAVAAALDATGDASVVLLLAVDLPLLSTADLSRLVARLIVAPAEPPTGAVAAADPSGRPNPLLAAYRASALRKTVTDIAGPGSAAGARGGAGWPAARLLPDGVTVVDLGGDATLNVNTPADLAEARGRVPQGPDGAC